MGTLVCRIELNKAKGKGIMVTVENADASITQTMVFDGTAITTKVQGTTATSTITQDQESVTIKCNDFTVDAHTILCKSLKNTTHKSTQKYTVESMQDMSFSTKMNLKTSSTMSTEMSATMNMKLKSDILLNAEGNITTVKGQITTVKGASSSIVLV